MIEEFVSDIHLWMDGIPTLFQWLMLIVLGGIPLVEAFLGSMVGTLLGIPVLLAVPAALLGNLLTVSLCAFFGKSIRTWWQGRRARRAERAAGNRQRRAAPSQIEGREEARLAGILKKHGTTGLCLLGPLIVPSQAAALVASGTSMPRGRVVLLIAIPATVLGFVGGTLGYLGINLLAS